MVATVVAIRAEAMVRTEPVSGLLRSWYARFS